MKCTLSLFLLMFTIWSFATHAFAQDFNKNHILKASTLDYPPYSYKEGNKETGIAVEILQEIVSRTKIKGVDIEYFPWKRAVFATRNGGKDILFNAGKNEGRQHWGHYSQHVLIPQKYYLFAQKGSSIKTDLKFNNVSSRSIAVRAGYLYGNGPFKKAIITPHTFFNIARTNSTKQSVMLLLNGRVDMFVGDRLPVMHYLKQHGLIDKIELVQDSNTDEDLVVLTWPTYFLFSKKSVPLSYVHAFDKAMETVIADGTYEAIYDKYSQLYQVAK